MNIIFDKILGKLRQSDGVSAEVTRKVSTPYVSHTYIAEGDDAPVAVLANTPTKYVLNVTAKEINGFGVFDLGGANQALQFQAVGASNVAFKLDASTSVTTNTNNCNIKLMLYKNGVMVDGSIVERKVGTGADTGAMSLDSTFRASEGDLLDVYVESDIATSITFSHTSIVILEI